jgi:hypothetical protein
MAEVGSSQGLYRISGMYGYAIMDGFVRAEITNVVATITIAKVEIPLVGATRMGIKPGRETRDGTFNIQKIDTHWEKYIHGYMSQSLAQRRKARGTQAGSMRSFSLQVWLDDPDALGAEVWQLNGCMLWDLPLGFDITQDVIDRSLSFGWETEKPLQSFEIIEGQTNPVTGQPAIRYLDRLSS